MLIILNDMYYAVLTIVWYLLLLFAQPYYSTARLSDLTCMGCLGDPNVLVKIVIFSTGMHRYMLWEWSLEVRDNLPFEVFCIDSDAGVRTD